MSTTARAAMLLLGGMLLVGCSDDDGEAQPSPSEAPVVQLGGPGEPNRELTDEEIASLETPRYAEADVRFVQSMIPHHGQALRMTGLVSQRTSSDDITQLALRMEVSQRDEIALMERWLEDRDEDVPDAAAHEHGTAEVAAAELMPGMLTDEEFAELEQATGSAFDRLFLQYMIRHHEGALQMVADLFSADGGQEPGMYQLAQHIDADQRIEISRMNGLLAALGVAPS
jgi:uncharacterized protein (DUF305 family)